MRHGATSEQFRRFVDDATRFVVNALDEEPAARFDNHQPSLGSSRQRLIGTVWQLLMTESNAGDLYE